MNRSRRATVFPCSLFVFTLLLGCGSDETSGDDSAAGSTGKDGTGGTGGTTSHVLFVDQAASEGGDGTSWAQAFTELGDALEVVGASGATEIWVAAGTYTPTHAPVELYQSFDRSENADGSCGDTSGTDFSDERWNTFLMRSGVAIYGGFAGTELERDERDWTANVTILSGDLDANDCYTTESCGAPVEYVVRRDGTGLRGLRRKLRGQRLPRCDGCRGRCAGRGYGSWREHGRFCPSRDGLWAVRHHQRRGDLPDFERIFVDERRRHLYRAVGPDHSEFDD